MIISHKHQFIFMHNQKTAGSSITAAINPSLGPFDEQTGNWPDTLSLGGSFNAKAKYILMLSMPRIFFSTAKNSLKEKSLNGFDPEYLNRIIKKHYRSKGLSPNGNPGHALASEVKAYKPDCWSKYFSFAITRNPWDHAVSYYYWKLKERNVSNISFTEFLKRMDDWARPDPEGVRPPRKSGFDIYAIDGTVAVDYVARLENLENDLAFISKTIGIPIKSGIRAKGNVRDKSKSLADHYDDESVELVHRIYKPEVDYFGYETPF